MEYYESELLKPMEYQKEPPRYPVVEKKPESKIWRVVKGQMIGAVVVGVCIGAMKFFWGDGFSWLGDLLKAGEIGPVEGALQECVSVLWDEHSLPKALDVLCQAFYD